MKRFFQFLLLIVPIVFSTSVAHAQIKMVITMNDGETYEFPVNDVAKMSWEEENDPNGGSSDEKPQTNNHEYVDLGLPSGTLWATCNVGANSPEEYGNYYAWGETEPKSVYDWSPYKWCKGSYDTLIKYNTNSSYGTVDNKTVLDLEDDAAHVNWGGDWRMPTQDEIKELWDSDNCTWSWITQNGVNGYRVTSKSNGNSIFLPAAGFRHRISLYEAGSCGGYWSSSLYSNDSCVAYFLNFYFGTWSFYSDYRIGGRTVRPVLSSAQNSQP